MSAEISMSHLSTFCIAVVTVFTYLPWDLLLLSALKVPRNGTPVTFHGPRMLNSVAFESNEFHEGVVLIDQANDVPCRWKL
jgi:hypothetical protein